LEYPDLVRSFEALYNEKNKIPVEQFLSILTRKTDDFFIVSKLFSTLTFLS